MGSGIFYNQSVTLDDLNNIAIDLGATSFNGFGENKFGAAELNNITKDLVGKGYLLKGNKCKVSASGDNLVILDGIVVFENGAKKEIAENLTAACVKGKVYYFLNDTASGTCRLCAEDDYPSSGDFVPLCEVQSDGTIVDKRVLSVAKVNLSASENNRTEDIEVTINVDDDNENYFSGTIPLEFSGYNAVIVRNIYRSGKWDTPSRSDKEVPEIILAAEGASTRGYMDKTYFWFEKCAEGLNVYGQMSFYTSATANTLKLKISLF